MARGRVAWLRFALSLLPALVFSTPVARAAVTEAWVQRYIGAGKSNDVAQAVVVDGNGNVVVTGYLHNGTNTDYYTAKYAGTNGVVLWERRYNGPDNRNDSAVAVAVDASNNVVVTGKSYTDYYTVKYAASDGAMLWEQRSNNGGVNGGASPAAMALDSNGNVTVTGFTYWIGGIPAIYTAKYAATNGMLVWDRFYNGTANRDSYATALAVDDSGDVIVTGYSSGGTPSGGGSGWNYYTAKYAAATGAILWEQNYNGPANFHDRAYAVKVDGNGDVVVTGDSWGGIQQDDYYTAKYAASDGALLWERRYSGPEISRDIPKGLGVDSNGNVFVTGTADDGAGYDFYTAKYAAFNGALLWEKRYETELQNEATALAVDEDGNVVVTGNSGGDYYTVKYAGLDGTELWAKRFNDPGSYGSQPSSLAVGSNGMVVVTGYLIPFGSGNQDYATVVYREVLSSVSIGKVPNGFRLRFTGDAGRSYQILRAPALNGPWLTNATLTALTNGPLEYIDTNTLSGSAFYRTSSEP